MLSLKATHFLPILEIFFEPLRSTRPCSSLWLRAYLGICASSMFLECGRILDPRNRNSDGFLVQSYGSLWFFCLEQVQFSDLGRACGSIYTTKLVLKNSVEVRKYHGWLLDMAMLCHQNVLDILSFCLRYSQNVLDIFYLVHCNYFCHDKSWVFHEIGRMSGKLS